MKRKPEFRVGLTGDQIEALEQAFGEVSAGETETWDESAWQSLNAAIIELRAARERGPSQLRASERRKSK